MFTKCKDACFPFGCTNAAAVDGRQGSNVYKVNTWLWSFGRGKPRLGGLSIEQTAARQDAAVSKKPKRVRKTAPGMMIRSKGWYFSAYSMMCTGMIYTILYCCMQR